MVGSEKSVYQAQKDCLKEIELLVTRRDAISADMILNSIEFQIDMLRIKEKSIKKRTTPPASKSR